MAGEVLGYLGHLFQNGIVTLGVTGAVDGRALRFELGDTAILRHRSHQGRPHGADHTGGHPLAHQ